MLALALRPGRPGCALGQAAALHDGRIDAYKAQLIAEATRVLDDAAAAAADDASCPVLTG